MSLPWTEEEKVWDAKAVSETYALKSGFQYCQVTIVEITTAAFSGTLDIQGRLSDLNAFANVPYIRQDQASIQTPSVSQISLTTDTGAYRYVILGYWPKLQLVMTRSAGTITCGVKGSSSALSFPYLVTQLIAGTAVIGKVSEPAVVETPFTGTGNIAVGVEKIAPAAAFKLVAIELHLSAAPTGANPNLVLTKDDGGSAVYDLNILTLDLVANAVTDLVVNPNLLCKSTDVITAAWTNTNGVTYGLIFKHQLV